jgi:hypothetical protein
MHIETHLSQAMSDHCASPQGRSVTGQKCLYMT